jgi:hypothetical protein
MSVTVRTNTRSLSLALTSSAKEEVGMGKLPLRSCRQNNLGSSGGVHGEFVPNSLVAMRR